MFASVLSAAILGMDVHPIQVEADVSDGLPTFRYGKLLRAYAARYSSRELPCP